MYFYRLSRVYSRDMGIINRLCYTLLTGSMNEQNILKRIKWSQ